MATSILIKVNRAAVGAILKSDSVREDLERRGQAIAAAAGEGMEVNTLYGKDRVSVFVRTGTPEAKRAEATQRSLTNAIDAGR
jgi:hypothetical protein